MPGIAVGIDLGTSTSCVAIARDGGVVVLPNPYGEAITASVACFREDGSILVGNAAKANIIHAPGCTITSSKRLIGRYFFSDEVKKARAVCSYEIVEGANHGVEVQVRGERYSLQEIAAMILREMRSIAEAKLGQPVTQAVITVPAYFNDNQRQATRDAGRIAGLEVLRILNEPTAAALAYGFGRGLRQRVAIYDLGGGTFDISILEIGDDVFEVLATAGDTFLGGDDLDDRIIDLLADEFVEKHGINLRSDPFSLEKLKLAAESAKKQLSVDDEVEIRIPDIAQSEQGSLSIERRIGAQEFGQRVGDLIQRTFKVCDEALQEAGMSVGDLDGVVLVGGPTRLPLVRESVRAYFQTEPRQDLDPDQAVAMGAAIHAASLTNPKGPQDAYLLDVTPLSLRIGVAGGLAESVIERNTPVPIEQSRTFTTFKDFQESVAIRVYQGESREAEENEALGQFEFSGFRKARRGEVEIEVSFEISADGIVHVTARDRATGEAASTRISLSSGLSESELKGILAGARGARVATSGGELVERRRGQQPEAATPALPEPETLPAAAEPLCDSAPVTVPVAAPITAPVTLPIPTPPSPSAASAAPTRAPRIAPAAKTAARSAAAAALYDGFLAPGADLELETDLSPGEIPLDTDLELDFDLSPPQAISREPASADPLEAPTDERPALPEASAGPALQDEAPTREIELLMGDEIEVDLAPADPPQSPAAADAGIELESDLLLELDAVAELCPEDAPEPDPELAATRHQDLKQELFEISDAELSQDPSGDEKA